MTFIIISIILFIFLLLLIRDDINQRNLILEIEEEYEKLFELTDYLANYYDSMLKKMRELDAMGGYETQDDFGVFFKYVKQSLLHIQEIFNENKSKE